MPKLNILQLTAGTGNFFCGTCLRDHLLVKQLIKLGHEVTILPLYLPLHTQLDQTQEEGPLFIGGVNFYLAEKVPFYDKLPQWFHRLLDSSSWLKKISMKMGMTRATELGKMTLSMLHFNRAYSKNEIKRLQTWTKNMNLQLDVIILSNALLLGLAPELKRIFSVPVVSTLQGEDTFLDSLPAPYSQQCWETLKEKSSFADAFIAVSDSHAKLMIEKGQLDQEKVQVIHNGVKGPDLTGAKSKADKMTVGYLARMCYDKGLDFLIDAFIEFKKKEIAKPIQLSLAGVKLPQDDELVQTCQSKLKEAGLEQDVQWQFNITHEEKQIFLSSLDVLSVPAHYGESFGLYIIEAWSHAIPVVQPDSGAFPEILEEGKGGVLFQSQSIEDWGNKIAQLYSDEKAFAELSQNAKDAFDQSFSIEIMSKKISTALVDIVQHKKEVLTHD